MVWFVLAAVLFLAYSNGANDNFKGVATLYGSGSASYRRALAWATLTTLAGSLLTLALASKLVQTFSAKGLVPDAVAAHPVFLGAVALGAAATVLLATRLGLPVSTTHALTGALAGAGVMAVGSGIRLGALGKSFFLPLLVSPVLATACAALLYPLARALRLRLGVERESCVCVGETWVPARAAPALATQSQASVAVAAPQLVVTARAQGCTSERYQGQIFGLAAHEVLDLLHFVSAGAVSFARGLNDTPKIVALLLGARALGATTGLGAVGLAMAIGGLLGARRVAETLAHRITTLNAGQGFVANFITAALVLGASRLGLPVSTTHVSTGGLFGIGLVNRSARWRTIATILVAWVTTLPLGALLGALGYLLLGRLG